MASSCPHRTSFAVLLQAARPRLGWQQLSEQRDASEKRSLAPNGSRPQRTPPVLSSAGNFPALPGRGSEQPAEGITAKRPSTPERQEYKFSEIVRTAAGRSSHPTAQQPWQPRHQPAAEAVVLPHTGLQGYDTDLIQVCKLLWKEFWQSTYLLC